jgi:hypothetical protein
MPFSARAAVARTFRSYLMEGDDQIRFKYKDFWEHVVLNVGTACDIAAAVVFDFRFQLSKYDRNDKIAQFVHRNLVVKRVDAGHQFVAENPVLFGEGYGYVVHESLTAHNTRKRGRLYVVGPKNRRGVLFGDHMTFVVNDNSPPEKRVNLHFTEYHPSDQDVTDGTTWHIYNPMPAETMLPKAYESFVIAEPRFKPYARLAHGLMMTCPQRGTPRQVGGARRKKKRSTTIRDFNRIWLDLPLGRILVLSLPNGRGSCDVTIQLTSRLRNSRNDMVFAIPGVDIGQSRDERWMQRAILERCSNMDRQTFEEVED